MSDTRFRIVIKRPESKKSVEIMVCAHHTLSQSQRLIDPEFYRKSPDPAPEGEHYEIEVLEPTSWGDAKLADVHVHRVLPQGKHFICWTGHLPTLEDVVMVLRIWSVGAVFAMEMNKDFGSVYTQDPGSFSRRMEINHGISLESLLQL